MSGTLSEATGRRPSSQKGGRLFRPIAYFESLALIKPADLRALGYRLLLLDVDNTITTWNNQQLAPEVERWFARLPQYNLRACLLSNNSAERLQGLADRLGIAFCAKARKPLPAGYRRAVQQMGGRPEHTLMLGDQLLTDILGASLAGLDSVLLRPISLAQEFRWTYVNRRIEKLFIKGVLARTPHNHFNM